MTEPDQPQQRLTEEYRIIIAGSRTITDTETVELFFTQTLEGMNRMYDITIVSGGANGVDACAKEIADTFGYEYREFPAQWARHGKSAGPIRNRKMAEFADVLIAVWDGQSAGTRNMIQEAVDAGLFVHVYPVDEVTTND